MNTLIKEKPLLTRFMALVFSFALALSMVPITALQANAEEVVRGDWGDCTWTIDDNGDGRYVLTISEGTNNTGGDTGGTSPWHANASKIYTVSFTGNIIAPTDCSGLFAGLPDEATINFSGFDANAFSDVSAMFDSDSIWTINGAAYNTSQLSDAITSGSTITKQVADASNVIAYVRVSPDVSDFDGTNKSSNVTVEVFADEAQTIKLNENDHYTVDIPYMMKDVLRSDSDHTDIAPYTIQVTGSNCYAGSSNTGYFTINPATITSVDLSTDRLTYIPGKSQKPEITAVHTSDGSTIAVDAKDYVYNNSFSFYPTGYTEVGENYTITITGKGNYTNSIPVTFSIVEENVTPEPTKTDISGVTIDVTHFVYNGEQQIPAVKDGDKTLVLNEDYTVIVNDSVLGSDATNAGEKTMTIYGKGDYEKSTSRQYTIAPIDISPDASPLADVKINLSQKTFDYDGNAQMVGVDSVEVNGRSLKLHSDSDYSPYDYYEIVEGTNTGSAPDTYAVQVRGLGNYTGTRSENWLIIDPSNPVKPIVSLELSDEDFTFIEGKEQIPTITVKDADGNIVEPANYNVKITNKDGEEDAITAGTKTVTVTANGDAYSGELTDTYEIKAAQEPTPEDPDDPKPENPDDPKPDDPAPENPDDPKPDDPAPENPNEPTPNDPQNPDDPGTPNDPQDPGTPNEPAPSNDTITMYRLYNPNNGEHFYTANQEEYEFLADIGWDDEGIGWIAPSSGDPVYRLYNAAAGEHHYTRSIFEKITLVGLGWTDEGVGWYSDKNMGTPLYRLYNPNQFANNHHYTLSKYEHDVLVGLGWQDERVSWWGVSAE